MMMIFSTLSYILLRKLLEKIMKTRSRIINKLLLFCIVVLIQFLLEFVVLQSLFISIMSINCISWKKMTIFSSIFLICSKMICKKVMFSMFQLLLFLREDTKKNQIYIETFIIFKSLTSFFLYFIFNLFEKVLP